MNLREIRKEKHQDVDMNDRAQQSNFNLTSQISISLCKLIYDTFLDLHVPGCRPVAKLIIQFPFVNFFLKKLLSIFFEKNHFFFFFYRKVVEFTVKTTTTTKI